MGGSCSRLSAYTHSRPLSSLHSIFPLNYSYIPHCRRENQPLLTKHTLKSCKSELSIDDSFYAPHFTMPRSYSSDCAESGYASGSSSGSIPEVYFSRPHLKFINQQLAKLEPQDILKWCITTLPRLYQTTAFGLTGLAINDMVSKLDSPIKPNVDLIYLVSN